MHPVRIVRGLRGRLNQARYNGRFKKYTDTKGYRTIKSMMAGKVIRGPQRLRVDLRPLAPHPLYLSKQTR